MQTPLAKEIRFHIHIPSDEFLRVYQGSAKHVVVQSENGQRVQFPAQVLRAFLTHAGVHGYFALQYDQNNKYIGIRQLG